MSVAFHYQVRTVRRRRLRFALGVAGVLGAMTLLSALGAGMDTYRRAYVEFATARAGRPDALVYPNAADRGAPPLFLALPVLRRVEEAPGIRGASARLHVPVATLEVGGKGGDRRVVVHGIDLDREGSLGLGETTPRAGNEPGRVVLSKATARRLDVEAGDEVALRVLPSGGEAYFHAFTVGSVIERQDLFESYAEEYAIVLPDDLVRALYDDLARVLEEARAGDRWLEEDSEGRRALVYLVLLFAERLGIDLSDVDPARIVAMAPFWVERLAEELARIRASAEPPVLATHLAVRFAEGEGLYDSVDLAAGVRRLRRVGEGVRERTGLEFRVALPRAEVLRATESAGPLLQTVFLLVAVLVLVASGLLVHSLLSISVEEKARDLAILRTLGARRSLVFRIVLSEASLMGALGIGLGIPAGLALARLAVGVLARRQGIESAELVVESSTLALAAGLGAFAVLASGLLPALRSAGARIVDGLSPSRTPTPAGRWSRDRGPDRRFAAIGLVVTFLVGLTTWTIVTVLASEDLSTAAFLVGSLVLTLVGGLTLTGQAVQPLFERALVAVLRLAAPVGAGFARQNLQRFRRRNASTSLLFSLSTAVVVLVGSIWTLQAGQIVGLSRFLHGADLRIGVRESPSSLLAPRSPFRAEFEERFGSRADAVSRVLQPREDGVSFSTVLSDGLRFEEVWVNCYGIDRDLPRAIFREEAAFAGGGFDDLAAIADASEPAEIEPEAERGEAVARRVVLHPDAGRIAISAAIAHRLGVGRGDTVLLRVTRGKVEREKRFEVAAVLRRLPGFRHVRASAGRAHGAAVLVSEREFGPGHLFPLAGARSVYLVRTDSPTELAADLDREIGQEYDLRIGDTAAEIARAEGWIVKSQVVLSFVLSLVVALAFLGLLASMYSSVLERARELAILKALGMRSRRILASLAVEGIALMTASGLVGLAAGYALALVLVRWVHDLMSELPANFSFPWFLAGSVVAWSVLLGTAGAWLSARRLLARPAAEMLRRAE